MTPERWQQVEQILTAALEREPAEHAAVLDKECAGDADLRAEVESLLAASEPAESFLGSNAFEDAAPLMNDWESGSIVGHSIGYYAIEKRIGAGGVGEVYLAEDRRLGRKVALKLLSAVLVGDEEARARFLREARLGSTLDHPNVCTVHEVGEADGHLFIAMQYVEGETLREIIGGRALPLDSLLSITLQVGDALADAHEKGVIHRDVKAGNIMITPRGQAKVLDFGLAKLLEPSDAGAETHLTVTGAVMGTPASMSPEQARGEHVDHRSDIFSFGCVLYEMATGQIPFKGRSRADVISALLSKPHIPAVELNKTIPSRLSLVIDRALAKEPGDRYETVPDMIANVRQVMAEAGGLDHLFSSSQVPRGIVPLVPPRRRGLLRTLDLAFRRRQPAVAIVLAVFVLALAGLGLALYDSRRAERETTAPIKSIAVLPFKPLSDEVRDEVLELGMADTLIAHLSNISEIDVRPVSAVHKYTGLGQDALAAGREQRVDAVLDGHIQKTAEKVRVTVRLLRVHDGSSLWADKFDAEMTDIFAVQDSITERVARALSVRLAGGDKERLTRHYTENSEAYQLYLKGRYHLNRLTDDGFLKGRNYFQQSIDIDPTYALAHAGLADAYQMLSGYNVLAPSDGFPKAKAAATEALKLAEGLSEAHAVLGTVKLLHDWDFEDAEREYKRAIELKQGNADAHYMYGLYLSAMGRFDEAHVEVRRAEELDPLSLAKIAGIGDVFYHQRQYDRAIAQYRQALEMDPKSGYAHWALGNVYVNKGMYEEAIAAYKTSIPLSGDSPDEPGSLAFAYALSGKRREAQAILNELKERSTRQYVSPTIIAFIYAGLGEKDNAFVWLNKAFDERDFILVFLKVDPTFDRVRSDSRFAKLMRNVGLPP